MTRKSYNPFKMWGSYVGAIIGALISPLMVYYLSYLPLQTTPSCMPGTACPLFAPPMSLSYFLTQNISFFIAFVGLISGFLIGWGIHSLVRALK